MSRIGKQPITIPSGVTVEISGNNVHVTGPKGELDVTILTRVSVSQEESVVTVTPKTEEANDRAQQGLIRTLIANAVTGVSEGFEKKLEVHGVGYRAQMSGSKLTLQLGFSHPIEYDTPDGIEVSVDNNIITVRGFDKQLVGQAAAHIRNYRKPEPYKGKGIRYEGEYVRRKAGKAVTK